MTLPRFTHHLLPLCLLATAPLIAADTLPKKPNIVIFLADDMGWGDAACFGSKVIKTPHLDKLASEGMRFTRCYSADSVCSPARAAILTGRTPYRNGVFRWIPEGHEVHLRQSEITIATLLQQNGYETCHSGKWHLNSEFNSPKQPQPNDHGYDWWFATQNNASPTHKNPVNFVRNGKEVGPLLGFSAPLVAAEAVDWLRNHRNPSKPFFLTVWTHEPHLPIESDPKFMALYKDIADPGVRQHHGNITQLDSALGTVLKELDQQKLSDNTLFIFTSDNGPEGKGQGNAKNKNSQNNRNWGSTNGLRGRKRHSYEGGIRVPGVIRWPGKIKPGSVTDTPIYGCDYLPTICDVVGIPMPTDRVIDGTSIRPVFTNGPLKRIQPMFWRNAYYEMRIAIIDDDWKIMGNNKHTQFELYNLKDDPSETTNVSKKFPERFERMKKLLIKNDIAVLADGPDWWKHEKPRKKKKSKKSKHN